MPDVNVFRSPQSVPGSHQSESSLPEQLALLDAALHAALGARSRTPSVRTRLRVRALCTNARSGGMTVEQLLVRVKEAWWRRSEVRDMPRAEASEALARVVTLCIREFFPDGSKRTDG